MMLLTVLRSFHRCVSLPLLFLRECRDPTLDQKQMSENYRTRCITILRPEMVNYSDEVLTETTSFGTTLFCAFISRHLRLDGTAESGHQ